MKALPDGCLDAPALEAEAPDQLQADADPSGLNAWDAWVDARPDAAADAEHRRHPDLADAGVEKSAGPAQDVPEPDAWFLLVRSLV